jgi:hypothetical protein
MFLNLKLGLLVPPLCQQVVVKYGEPESTHPFPKEPPAVCMTQAGNGKLRKQPLILIPAGPSFFDPCCYGFNNCTLTPVHTLKT